MQQQQQSRELVTHLPRRAGRNNRRARCCNPMAAPGRDAATCCCHLPLPPRFLLVLVATLITLVVVAPARARAAWVEDYPSGVPCGVTIPVEQCDPGDAAANSACRDVCHYGGARRGGQCASLGLGRGRGCHCKC